MVEGNVVVGSLDPWSTCESWSLCLEDYVKSSVERWCWFIYGACVSCSSILCSIYSQYTFEDGVFIFIEISSALCTNFMQWIHVSHRKIA